jgi:hypothetical protein
MKNTTGVIDSKEHKNTGREQHAVRGPSLCGPFTDSLPIIECGQVQYLRISFLFKILYLTRLKTQKDLLSEDNVACFQGHTHLRPGLLKLLCGASKLGRIWSAQGQHEIQYTELRMKMCTCTYLYNCTVYFAIHHVL